jgi:iron complex outermembrane recepter protein
MKPNPKISAAVAAIVGASSTSAVLAAPADEAAATATTGELAEVTVTAERRTENIQDVPITVQAITGEQLSQLNVTNFNDLLKYTPNVTFSGNGPGTGNVFIRGLGGIGSGNQSQSTTAAFPNVALYLDDQSMQFPARNNDPYVVDLERIEVLEGPQGTLFGGGAQAGAIRYITNKPKLDVTSGEFNAGYGITANGGDPNTQLNAVLNIPLVSNTLALRAVVFSERQGGYIDNVPGTIGYQAGSNAVTMGGNPTANNAGLIENNTNPVDYQGLRVSLLWKINEDWNFLIQQNYQNMEADGYFYAYPEAPDGQALQPYQITAFTPAWSKDKYESTAWTLNGHFAGLDAVYTGSYMVRHIDGQQDYSGYLRSTVGSFYGCIGNGAGYFNPAKYPGIISPTSSLQCADPTGSWRDVVENQHHSEEFRLSTDQSNRLRGLVGAFWEKFVIDDQMNFNYLGIPQCSPQNLSTTTPNGPYCLSAVGPVPLQYGARATDPSLRENTDTAFGEDAQRGYKQTAFFASIDFDLIPKTLTLTGGGRWYHYDEFEEGSEFYTESSSQPLLINHANGSCTNAGACGFPINLAKTETGTRWRGDLTWHITPDIMAYYTYSQGFRPGGFNRTSSLVGEAPSLSAEAPYSTAAHTDQYLKPAGYNSDNLINNEIGFKSEFFDHHLLFNATYYWMYWDNIQLSLFDPVHLGNTTFNVNGPSYQINGFEVQFVARITDGLTVEGSTAVNSPKQTNAPCLESVGKTSNAKTANNPTPAGTCITQIVPAGTTTPEPYSNPFGELGTRPAFSPPWMFNIRARYEWAAANYHWFGWVGASHIASMSNEPASFPDGNAANESPPTGWPTTTLLRYEIPGYTTYDAALGTTKDNWTVQIQAHNLSNEYGPTNISSGQFIKSEIPLRPRVLMFLMSYRF